jgi:two-component system chemotaxis response regulator CheY
MTPKKTILTVDDSRTMRDMLASALTQSGYRVVQADDGVQAIDMLANETPDVIITDINMPRLDGFGFIEEVRNNPKYRAIPILVLTTENSPEMKERARRSGATGWLVKPFDTAKLTDAIRRVGA